MRELIAVNKAAQTKHIRDAKDKIAIYTQAHKLACQMLPDYKINKKEFDKGFVDYVTKAQKDINPALKNVGQDVLHSMLETPHIKQLQNLQRQYARFKHVVLNKAFTEAIELDFGIYTENKEELKRLKIAKDLIANKTYLEQKTGTKIDTALFVKCYNQVFQQRNYMQIAINPLWVKQTTPIIQY